MCIGKEFIKLCWFDLSYAEADTNSFSYQFIAASESTFANVYGPVTEEPVPVLGQVLSTQNVSGLSRNESR